MEREGDSEHGRGTYVTEEVERKTTRGRNEQGKAAKPEKGHTERTGIERKGERVGNHGVRGRMWTKKRNVLTISTHNSAVEGFSTVST